MSYKNTEYKNSCLTIILGLLLVAAIIGVVQGPAGIERGLQRWGATAYGSDWLVVQYAQDGSLISVWELTDRSIASEHNSDGINFVDNHGNMVHLSGHYVYVQVKDFDGLKKARDKLVKGRRVRLVEED